MILFDDLSQIEKMTDNVYRCYLLVFEIENLQRSAVYAMRKTEGVLCPIGATLRYYDMFNISR